MKKLIYILLFLYFQPALFAQINIARNKMALHSSAIDYNQTAHLVTDGFQETYWQSKANEEQWIYIDLGRECKISDIKIYWGKNYARDFEVQISNSMDRKDLWETIKFISNANGGISDIKLTTNTRFIRLLLKRSSQNQGYSINEIEVFGSTKDIIIMDANANKIIDGSLYLTNKWKLQRAAFVKEEGAIISLENYNAKDWIPAVVPGTALVSYLKIGAIPDPFYADQQLQISESFFTSDFWYRNTFSIPENFKGKRIWLNFDGINWKAAVFLNGKEIGNIEGAYIRGKFDITEYVNIAGSNTLAVLVHKNDHPGEVTEQHLQDPDGNGGIIGYDSPTILASIGWNWIPTIRGRNTGIWNDVYLSSSNEVLIKDPFIKTDFNLPDTSIAKVRISLNLINKGNSNVEGTLNGSFGKVKFELPVSLKAAENKQLILDENLFSQFIVKNPALWWPNGYGAQNLDTLNLVFTIGPSISDQKQIVFGYREYSYQYSDNLLQLFVNGFPVLIRGGNWGMAEGLMRCDAQGYDLRVRLHKEMNMNMIRNWIGMIGDEEFYQSCDKYGIMVWDDFWLANPVDGPHPLNNNMFMNNVRDKILQRRNHACLALWCGRNEGYPPAVLDSAMAETVGELDDTRHYISSSAHKPVTGLGPYETKDPAWYFTNRGTTLHSEQGIVCFPTLESLKAMMPQDKLWPVNDMWGLHDWTQPRVKIFTDAMDKNYGRANSVEDFCQKAQMLNMEGPKAMFESWQSNRRGGVLVWMSHPAWPSLICQTYDYYFDPSAAYFAFKNAGEPVHALWRIDNNWVQVANNSQHEKRDTKLFYRIFDFNAKLLVADSSKITVKPNTTSDVFQLSFPKSDSGIYFIQLVLLNNQGKLISENFYWCATEYQNYKPLANLPKVNIRIHAEYKDGSKNKILLSIENPSGKMAIMAHAQLIDKSNGQRILPVFYTDNYFSLVPKQKRTIEIEFTPLQPRSKPAIYMEGWNIEDQQIDILTK